jgi:hypothetical protein
MPSTIIRHGAANTGPTFLKWHSCSKSLFLDNNRKNPEFWLNGKKCHNYRGHKIHKIDIKRKN